jgi:hypothetical protein
MQHGFLDKVYEMGRLCLSNKEKMNKLNLFLNILTNQALTIYAKSTKIEIF